MHVFLEQAGSASANLESVGFVVTLILVGLSALAVELFILPGFGLAGVIGILGLVGGSIAAWLMLGPFWGGATVALSVVVSIALTLFVFRSKTLKKRLVLDTQLEQGGGTGSEQLRELIGRQGVAKSDLRPAGIVLVGDLRLDVVSEGGFIESGTKVKIEAVDGPRVIVARAN